jgi:hypothetical protein
MCSADDSCRERAKKKPRREAKRVVLNKGTEPANLSSRPRQAVGGGRFKTNLLGCRNLAASSRNVLAKKNPGRFADARGSCCGLQGLSGLTRHRTERKAPRQAGPPAAGLDFRLAPSGGKTQKLKSVKINKHDFELIIGWLPDFGTAIFH